MRKCGLVMRSRLDRQDSVTIEKLGVTATTNFECAQELQRLLDELGKTYDDAAQAFSVSAGTVNNWANAYTRVPAYVLDTLRAAREKAA